VRSEAVDRRTAPAKAGAILVGHWSQLEGELACDLHNAIVAGARDDTEGARRC